MVGIKRAFSSAPPMCHRRDSCVMRVIASCCCEEQPSDVPAEVVTTAQHAKEEDDSRPPSVQVSIRSDLGSPDISERSSLSSQLQMMAMAPSMRSAHSELPMVQHAITFKVERAIT